MDDISTARYLGSISAGFPSPGEDWKEQTLNLHDLVVKNTLATFFMKVAGDSMIGACISEGDILVVDRSLTAAHKKIVIARLGERFTIKRLWIEGRRIYLKPENPRYRQLEMTDRSDFEIWGVVTYVVKKAL